MRVFVEKRECISDVNIRVSGYYYIVCDCGHVKESHIKNKNDIIHKSESQEMRASNEHAF